MEEKLNLILGFVIRHKDRININPHTIHEHLFLKSISFDEAKHLFDKIVKSGKVKVYGGRFIGYSVDTELFLNSGGFIAEKIPAKEKIIDFNTDAKQPTLFMSYCWAESEIAEGIYSDLVQIGVTILKDNHQLNYKDSIKSFMNSIRDSDYAVILVSDEYLKSKNCIYELLQLLKEKQYHDKILPIIIEGTKIYSASDRIKYIKFWEQKCVELKAEIGTIDPVNSLGVLTDLKLFTEISQNIGEFLSELGDMLHISLKKLQETHYKSILEKIGFEDISFAVNLMAIASTEDIEQREIMLDQYAKKYPLNSYYYSIKAGTNAKAKRYNQAVLNYLEAIQLNPGNVEALNNLGLIYHDVNKDLPKAVACFRKAVALSPKFTVAKLNLGFALGKNPENIEETGEIYKDIISYDPYEPKAYNNLANYYKVKDYKGNFELSKENYEKAMELKSDYVEPFMGYANLLKMNGMTEEGNAYYRKALELDNGYYKPFIEAALTTIKG